MFNKKNQEIYSKKKNLLNFTYQDMVNFFLNIKEEKFRAQQIMYWIYKKYCLDFNSMSNFNIILKEKLKKIAILKIPKCISYIKSLDGTIKWKFLINKNYIESVYIPEKNRSTLCISSQIGCVLNCSFCATGKMGYKGNLQVSEIIGQILYIIKIIQEKEKKSITNIVMMGMGEPLLNFNNVVQSIKIMLCENGFNFSKNKVTLSTAGIVPGIKKLIGKIDVSLAISLHASNNHLRSLLMPINKIYNIQQLLSAVKEYLKFSNANRNTVTFEYVMLKNVNDRDIHIRELCILLKNIRCKINLIPWNILENVNYKVSDNETIKKFSLSLIKNGFHTTIRKNRGIDIKAACGQLINRLK